MANPTNLIVLGLVLSSGGDNGAWQVGVMKYLLRDLKREYKIVAGTSVGAVNALGLSQFKPSEPEKSYKYLENLWLNLDGSKVKKNRVPPYIFTPCRSSIYDSDPLRQYLKSKFDYNPFTKSGRILRIEAASLTTGKIRAWNEGSDENEIIEATMASCATPGLLPPILIDNEWYIDGGVINITPIQSAIEAGATEIDVILTATKDFERKEGSFKTIDIMLRSFLIMQREIIENDLKFCNQEKCVKVNVFRPPEFLPGGGLDFDPEIIRKEIDMGYEYAKQQGIK